MLRSALWIILICLVLAGVYLAVAQSPESPSWISGRAKELSGPANRIDKSNIHVYPDRVVIDIKDPQWATFADTNSMDPVFDNGNFAIEVVPKSQGDIHIGDIISYDSFFASGTLVHRVVEIGDDGEWYAIAKGDNNPDADPGKVRFGQVRRVMAMIIY